MVDRAEVVVGLFVEPGDINPHPVSIPKGIQLPRCGAPEFLSGGSLPHVKFKERGGEIDQSLNKSGRIGPGRIALPEPFPGFVRLPKVEPVEKINTAQVCLDLLPLVRCPERMNLGADGAAAVSSWIADRMGEKTGDESIRRERPFLGIPGEGLHAGGIGNG